MFKFFKKISEERNRRKMIIKSAIERKKTDFVFRYLLMNYEKQTNGTIDLPAFIYANQDMLQIKKENKLNEAYFFAKEALRKDFEIEFAKKMKADIWGV